MEQNEDKQGEECRISASSVVTLVNFLGEAQANNKIACVDFQSCLPWMLAWMLIKLATSKQPTAGSKSENQIQAQKTSTLKPITQAAQFSCVQLLSLLYTCLGRRHFVRQCATYWGRKLHST